MKSTANYPGRALLIADHEQVVLDSLSRLLAANGNLIACRDAREVVSLVGRENTDLPLLDPGGLYLPREELLAELQAEFPRITVIVVTGADDLDTTVRCSRPGLVTTWSKPWRRAGRTRT